MGATPGIGASVGDVQRRVVAQLGHQGQVVLPGHLQRVVVAEVPVEDQGGQREKPGDEEQQSVEQGGNAPSLWGQRRRGFRLVLAPFWTPARTLGGGGCVLLGLRFRLAGRFFCGAAHDLRNAERDRAPLLDTDQGQREAGAAWHRLAIETGKEPTPAMRHLAGFGGDNFIAHQPVVLSSTVDMLTQEHPKQHGPWERLREKALHGPITTAWARPAGDAQHRHACRHHQQRRDNTAALMERCSGHSGSEALQKC